MTKPTGSRAGAGPKGRLNFMKSKIAIAVFIVLSVIGGLVGVKMLQIRAMAAAIKSFVPPPVAVSSAVAKEEQWQDTFTSIGSITAMQRVTITPAIPCTVREIAFNS